MSEAQYEMDRHYPELVRLAYLMLPGDRPRKYRLALARRIAEESLPRRRVGNTAKAHAKARTRVLARSMRQGPVSRARLRIGLVRWLGELPAVFAEIPGAVRLRELPPEVRAAYVLRKVEAQYFYAVRDQLAELGVPDAGAVVRAADRLAPSGTVLTGPAVPVPIPPIRRGPRLHSRLPVATAIVLTAVLIGGTVLTGNDMAGNDTGHAHRPVGRQHAAAGPAAGSVAAPVAGPAAGLAAGLAVGPALGAAGWPARGDLVDDKIFVSEALAAWRTGGASAKRYGVPAGPPGGGGAGLLYAGRVAGADIALLSDGRRIARYVRGGARPGLELFPVGSGGAPLIVADGRYLVPPRVTAVRAAALTEAAGTEPNWRPVVVRDGLTDPLPLGTGSKGCWNGPILGLKEPDGERTVADLSGPAGSGLTVAGLALPALALPGWSADTGRPSGSGAAADPPAELGCALTRPAGMVTAASLSRFWTGKLPDGTAGSWVCAGYTYLDGRTEGRATFFEGGGDHYGTGNCGGQRGKAVSGMWWRPGPGNWYYLTAASRGLIPGATGPFQAVGEQDGLFIGMGAKGKHPPKAAVTPTAHAR